MRNLLILGALATALAGCGSSSADADGTVKEGSGVALNPGGKPKDDTEAARQSAMQQQGNAMNDQRAQAASAEAAAKAASGGK